MFPLVRNDRICKYFNEALATLIGMAHEAEVDDIYRGYLFLGEHASSLLAGRP